MTKLIRVSERDVSSLERILKVREPVQITQPDSYDDVVVVKPWGHEFLVFQNDHVAIWYLYIQQGHSTSMHCHPRKKTSLIVLAGQALCNTFYNRNYLTALDAGVIEKGVFHTTKSLSREGVHLLEVETPPAKTDLVRLDDEYGRAGQGYEGLADMKRDNLDSYNYFQFGTPPHVNCGQHVAHGAEIKLTRVPAGDERYFQTNRGEFYCVCEGQVFDDGGNSVLEVGDAAEGCYLGAFNGLQVRGNGLFLSIRPTP